MDLQQQTTSQVQPIDYNLQTQQSVIDSIKLTLTTHFPEYIMKHQEHSTWIYLYLCDPLQKDLQVTQNVTYLEVWVNSKRRRDRTRYRSQYKVRIDSNISTSRTTVSCDYNNLKNFHRRIRNAITKLQEQIATREARRKADEAERLQREKDEAIKRQAIMDYLTSKDITFQIRSDRSPNVLVAGDLQVHKVDDEYIYVWHHGLKRIYACNFKEYIEAYETFTRLAHEA